MPQLPAPMVPIAVIGLLGSQQRFGISVETLIPLPAACGLAGEFSWLSRKRLAEGLASRISRHILERLRFLEVQTAHPARRHLAVAQP